MAAMPIMTRQSHPGANNTGPAILQARIRRDRIEQQVYHRSSSGGGYFLAHREDREYRGRSAIGWMCNL